jgi:hypothetical protein
MTDYNFLDPPQNPQVPQTNYDFVVPPQPVAVENELVQAGRRLNVMSLRTGKPNAILQDAAESHAAFMAKVGQGGHQDFDDRVAVLFKRLPEFTTFSEVAAQSWENRTEKEAAAGMYVDWESSPQHWAAVNGPCAIWGYAMALSKKNGLWYACGLFAQRRK